MRDEADYYAVLGVSPSSEDVVIQAAYRALMRRYHPDTNCSPEAARKCIEINAAYAVLGDPAARAAYDARRHQQDNSAERVDAGASTVESQSGDMDAKTRSRSVGAILVYSLFIVGSGILGTLVVINGAHGSHTADSNTMNVDENLTTADLNATDMSAVQGSQTDINSVHNIAMPATADLNAIATDSALPPNLSQQVQSAVSYSTIESAAWRFATLLRSQGLAGARTYSERCHKGVKVTPTWDGADSCAAFDYAAAYIDEAVSRNGGWSRNGYFEFQRANQGDNYAAVGAPSYLTYSRLNQIKAAAEESAAEALRTQLARERPNSAASSAVTTDEENQTSNLPQ
jgi:curved DNA-binding protein CbpA